MTIVNTINSFLANYHLLMCKWKAVKGLSVDDCFGSHCPLAMKMLKVGHIRWVYDKTPRQWAAACQRRGKCPAVDSCEQVAKATGIFDMPGMPTGFVILSMTRLWLAHSCSRQNIRGIFQVFGKLANTAGQENKYLNHPQIPNGSLDLLYSLFSYSLVWDAWPFSNKNIVFYHNEIYAQYL